MSFSLSRTIVGHVPALMLCGVLVADRATVGAAASAPACPPGRYVVASAPAPLVIELGSEGRLGLQGCGQIDDAQFRRRRVRGTWPACSDGAPVRLKARFAMGCRRLRGWLRAGAGPRRRIAARLSQCGDGRLDVAVEQCDGATGCVGGAVCTTECTCSEPPPDCPGGAAMCWLTQPPDRMVAGTTTEVALAVTAAAPAGTVVLDVCDGIVSDTTTFCYGTSRSLAVVFPSRSGGPAIHRFVIRAGGCQGGAAVTLRPRIDVESHDDVIGPPARPITIEQNSAPFLSSLPASIEVHAMEGGSDNPPGFLRLSGCGPLREWSAAASDSRLRTSPAAGVFRESCTRGCSIPEPVDLAVYSSVAGLAAAAVPYEASIEFVSPAAPAPLVVPVRIHIHNDPLVRWRVEPPATMPAGSSADFVLEVRHTSGISVGNVYILTCTGPDAMTGCSHSADSTVEPKQQVVADGTNEYRFTVHASSSVETVTLMPVMTSGWALRGPARVIAVTASE